MRAGVVAVRQRHDAAFGAGECRLSDGDLWGRTRRAGSRDRDQCAERRRSRDERDARDSGRRVSKDDLTLLPADRVTNRIEYIDEVARRAHFTEQRDARQHFHLVARDIVDAPELVVLAEIFPRRFRVVLGLRRKQRLGARIGEEEKFPPN